MKKTIIVLMAIGCTYLSANAQSSVNSKYAKNYRICLAEDKYVVCDQHENTTQQGRITDTEEVFGMQNAYVHLGYASPGNARYRGKIRVSYDDKMNDPYKGESSMANDGVKKNIQRNVNYLDTANPIPSNDGGLSNRSR